MDGDTISPPQINRRKVNNEAFYTLIDPMVFNGLSNAKRSVHIYVESLQNGNGTERAAVSLANALCFDYKIKIISLKKQCRESPFALAEAVSYGDLGVMAKGNAHKVLKTIAALRSVRGRNDNEIIISTLPYLTIAIQILLRPKVLLAWEHASYDYFPRWVRVLKRITYRSNVCVVSLTEQDVKFYQKYQCEAIAIPNIVEQAKSTQKMGEKRLLFVGRLAQEKGISALVKILKKFYDTNQRAPSDWETLIVGDGPLMSCLEKDIQGLVGGHKIKLLGKHENISEVYRMAAIFLCTSESESFGLAMVEAMSYGIATVAFDTGLGPQAIVKNGVNGFLIENRDTDSFVRRLTEICSDDELLHCLNEGAKKTAIAYTSEKIVPLWVGNINKRVEI